LEPIIVKIVKYAGTTSPGKLQAKFHRHLHQAASIELARHTRQLQQYGPRPLQRAWAASWTMEFSAETGDFLLWFPEMWVPNRSNSWMVYFMENPTKMDDLGGSTILGNLHVLLQAR
jgi:hypothetical protein